MSYEAMEWVAEQQLPANQKVVLFQLAYRTNSKTGKCFPKIKVLAKECGMSETTTKLMLKKLRERGLIQVQERYHEDVRLSNQYNLLMKSPQLELDGVGQNPTDHPQAAEGRVGRNPTGNEQGSKQGNEHHHFASSKGSTQPTDIRLPLNTGEEYVVSQEEVEEFSLIYPAVDIVQSLKRMRGWLLTNPQRRKTSRGLPRFMNSWLARDQDKGMHTARPSIRNQGNVAHLDFYSTDWAQDLEAF